MIMNWPNIPKMQKKRSIPTLMAVGALALLLTACGSTSTTSSSTTTTGASTSSTSNSGVAAASAALAKYSSVQPPVPPGPAFDASKASGKLVWLVEWNPANPPIAIVAKNIETALAHENVKVLTCNANNVSVEMASCMIQGLSQHPAAIITVGASPSSFASATQAANAAHVPVIVSENVPFLDASDSAVIAPILKGIAANAALPYSSSGALAADYVVKDSNANAHVLFIGSPGVLGSQYEQQSFTSTLKKLCPKCTLDLQAVALPNWASDVGPTVSAQLQLHPHINYVVPVFDPMAAYSVTAIQQAGKASSVKIVTADGSLPQMINISQGKVIVCDVGQDLALVGFLAVDETLRYISGAPSSSLVKEEQSSPRVFSTANVGSLSLTPTVSASGAWYTGSATAMPDMFYKLWSGS